ncbi:MAG: hypothetical protein Q4F05_12020 [bacterium]|nr:hypothetical protein [bacterium]
MIYKEEPLTNTVTIHYQYQIRPEEDAVTKVSTASVQSNHIIVYDNLAYKPVQLLSYLPLPLAKRRNIIRYTQEITSESPVRYPYCGRFHILVSVFYLHTTITYYDPYIKQYRTAYWKKAYRMIWPIPSHYGTCTIYYRIIDQSLQPYNFFTITNSTYVSVEVFSKR